MPDTELASATVTAKCRLCDEVVHHDTFTQTGRGHPVTNAAYWASSNKCLRAMEEHYRKSHNVTDMFDID